MWQISYPPRMVLVWVVFLFSIYFQYLSITLLVTLYVTEYNYKLKQLLTIYQGVHITYFDLNPECDKLYSFVRMILAKLIPLIASNEV